MEHYHIVGPMVKFTKEFHPVSIEFNRVLVKGGYNKCPVPAQTRCKKGDSGTLHFLSIRAHEPWLIHGAAGSAHISDGLSNRTTLLRDLKAQQQNACLGMPTVSRALRRSGEAGSADADPDDLMNALSSDEEVSGGLYMRKKAAKLGDNVKRNRYYDRLHALTYLQPYGCAS